MSTDTDLEIPREPIGHPAVDPDRVVEVRRRAGLAVALGAGASVVAIAYLARAVSHGGVLDWALFVVLGAIGVVNLAALLDARTPLLVADDLGVRLRLGSAWVGLPWGGLHEVEHRPQRGWWRDGLLVVRPHYVQHLLEDLSPGARRTARVNRRLHHAPLAVPLGLATRVLGAEPALTEALARLADGRTPVVEAVAIPVPVGQPQVLAENAVSVAEVLAAHGVEAPAPAPSTRRLRDPRPAIAMLIGAVAARFERTPRDAETETEVAALLIDDYAPQAAPEPVIGPQFAAARRRLTLTVDQLAERTRIRPHVIEAIEVDDFSACGGDFYARGHLRTLARILGLDVAPLLETYDERYADAPIDPRRVFEAELAGAGSIRATRGGPNWSVLVAAVMALILCWSVARLVTGGPGQVADQAVLSGSGGPNHTSAAPVSKPVPVVLTAAGGGARVVVRSGTGAVVFSGELAFGQQHRLEVSPPVRIQSTDGAVRVQVAGQDRGRMGPAGRPASQSYVVRR
jgi:hypothetical protein